MSSFIPSWSENTLCMYCASLFRCVFWPWTRSALARVPRETRENALSAARSILQMSIRSSWLIAPFGSSISLLIFHLLGLRIWQESVEASAVIMNLSVPPLGYISLASCIWFSREVRSQESLLRPPGEPTLSSLGNHLSLFPMIFLVPESSLLEIDIDVPAS